MLWVEENTVTDVEVSATLQTTAAIQKGKAKAGRTKGTAKARPAARGGEMAEAGTRKRKCWEMW